MSDNPPAEIRSDFESIRRLWQVTGPLRREILLGMTFRFAQSLCLGMAFAAVLWVVTGIAAGRTIDTGWIVRVSGLMMLSLGGQMLFSYLSVKLSWLSSYALAGELRLVMLDRLGRLPMGFHLSRGRGDTVTALTTDMQMLEAFLSDALPRFAQAFGIPVIIVLFLAISDWLIAAAALASIVASAPVFVWSSRRLAALGIRRQDLQAQASGRMIEYAQGIAVTRAFGQIFKGQESFAGALKAFRDISIEMIVRLTIPLLLFGMILMMGTPLVIVTAGFRHIGGEIDSATHITVLVLLLSIYKPLLGLASIMELSRQADASLTRIDRIMAAQPLPEPASAAAPHGFAVDFDGVGFSYGPGKAAINDLSFTIPERTMTAIVGPSGSGKSTILSLISRFWDINGGAIRIGDCDIRQIGTARLNELISVVFQDVYLFSGTIAENIAFGRSGVTQADLEAAARAAQAHDFIMALPDGYRTLVGEGGSTLSGGERQRISIARALLKDAPIVLLDEATAAIDPTNERAIQQTLAQLAADRTLVVVAHKLSTIEAADQILMLDGGRLVDSGSHAELINRTGLYRRFWEHRKEAASWRL